MKEGAQLADSTSRAGGCPARGRSTQDRVFAPMLERALEVLALPEPDEERGTDRVHCHQISRGRTPQRRASQH